MARQREFDKQQVIERAMLLFWQQGYEATSMRDLQKATGISSSSMYEVFGDKRALFLAALAYFCTLERAKVTQMADMVPTPQAFLEQLFASVELVALPDSRTQGSMAFNAMVEFGTQDTDITTLLLAHYFGIAEIIAAVMKQGQADGMITSQESPENLAFTILSTLQGLATVKGVKPDFPYVHAITQLIVKLLKL